METTHQHQLPSYFENNHHQSYTFYFDINQDLPLKVTMSLEPRLILEEALAEAIVKANQLLVQKGISLKKELTLYKPRLAGKNFKPKTDMPGLSLYQKICDLKVNEIAIQILKKQEAIVTQTQPQKPQTVIQESKPLLEPKQEKQQAKTIKDLSDLKISQGASETK